MYSPKGYSKKLLYYLLVTIFVVTIDQFFKRLILSQIGMGSTSEFIKGFVQFSIVKNTGGAFSMLNEFPLFFQIIGIMNIVIFSYLTFCPTVAFSNLIKTGCAFILGGTISNLIDRFFRGGVIDYLDFEFINFAVFNLADAFIDLGVILILIGWFFCRGKSRTYPK